MDAAYASDAHALLATLTELTADVHLRALVVKAKCEELERALQYVDSLRARREAQRDARQARATQADAETQQVHASIQNAIQRARQIRDAPATKATSSSAGSSSDSDHKKGEDEDVEHTPLARDANLQSILAMAKSIRAHAPIDATAAAPTAAASPKSLSEPSPLPVTTAPPIRIEYPRRMKALIEQLEDIAASAQHESFRTAFCRKMAEHVTLRPPLHDPQVPPASKVQVGFVTQAARLAHAHEQLAAFLRERTDPASARVAAALAADATLATIFPVFTRMQQGTRMAKVLRDEALAFAARAPAPPRPLSSAAVAHRDAVLKRLTKQPQQRASPSAVTNADLVATDRQSDTATEAHRAMLARLQTAWDASYGRSDTTTAAAAAPADAPAYDTAVREVVLTETSNLVLTLFKTIFVDDPDVDDPAPEHITHMLLLIRLVDSVALANGRRMRSVVARAS